MKNNSKFRPFDSLFILAFSLAFGSAVHAANGEPFEDLQNQVEVLQGKIDQLTGTDPIEISVTCGQDTIADALTANAAIPAPLVITISGMCEESVSIQRSNVTLQGGAEGTNGLTLFAPAYPAIEAKAGASGIVIQNLTLNLAGGWGATCVNNTVAIDGVVMNYADVGIIAAVGGSCTVADSEINGAGSSNVGTRGVVVGDQSVLQLGTSTIRDVEIGVYLHSHADAFIGNVDGGSPSPLIEHTLVGAQVLNGSNLTLGPATTISDNVYGIEVFPNSTLGVNIVLYPVPPSVSNNTSTGIVFYQLTSLTSLVNGALNVDDNAGFGIVCDTNVAFAGQLPSLSGNNGGGAQHDGCPLP